MSIKDTKDFIEKAIEGGYKEDREAVLISDAFGKGFHMQTAQRWEGEYLKTEHSKEEILLDPLSWQAVGRVERWNGTYCNGCGIIPHMHECQGENVDEWVDKMHGMIDALIEGKTTDEYLKTL